MGLIWRGIDFPGAATILGGVGGVDAPKSVAGVTRAPCWEACFRASDLTRWGAVGPTLQDQKETSELLHFKLMVMFQTLVGRSRKRQNLNCICTDDLEGRTVQTAQSKQATWPDHIWARDAVKTCRVGPKELRQPNDAQWTSFFKQPRTLTRLYVNQGREPRLKRSRF